VRVDSPRSADTKAALTALNGLSTAAGVDMVTTDARTGSALLTYDPDELDLDSVLTLVRGAHEVLEDVAPPPVEALVGRAASDTAIAVQRRATALDQSVLKATHGAVDLRMLLPVGLAGLSLRALSRQGIDLKSVPWYVLAYYSFDTFLKLHGNRGVEGAGFRHDTAEVPR
jgi:hypothetical protein